MKTHNIHSFVRIACIVCFVALSHVVCAQTEGPLPANTPDTLLQESNPAPTTRPVVLIFGKVYSSKILAVMPQYQAMHRNLQDLKAQYEAEARKSESDFQRKFEEFMQGKDEYPKTILEKRQNELQNMLETNAAFRLKVQTLLQEAEKSMLADVKAELNDAISVVAKEKGITIVFDMDGEGVSYILPNLALDITSDVIGYLNNPN